jgi:hypothetical protein
MGAVGQWDGALFDRFRAEREPKARQRLFGELARVHAPLITHLAKRMARHPWAGGSHRLAWPEKRAAAELAFARRLPDYDPTRGASLSTFLAKPVLFEIQKAIQEVGVVRRGTKQRLAEVDFLECPEEIAAQEAGAASALDAAIDRFLEEHCHFVESARVAANEVRGRYESVVVGAVARGAGAHRYPALMRAREEAGRGGALLRALDDRGVRRTMVRVPWAPGPVRGFAGVRLRIDPGLPAHEGARNA